MCVEKRETKRRYRIVQCMPTAGKPGREKTGFVYADAQTVHLACLLHAVLYLLSNVNTSDK